MRTKKSTRKIKMKTISNITKAATTFNQLSLPSELGQIGLTLMLVFTVFASVCPGLANAQVTNVGGVTVFNVQNPGASVDFVNAQPMPLPINPFPSNGLEALIQALESTQQLGTPGHSAGAEGTGITTPVFLGTPAGEGNNQVLPPDYGTNSHPFSTARADLFPSATNQQYPYRAAGKLFFTINGAGYVCSASLIKRGVIVTAAHCVVNYGKNQVYSNWQFVPGYRSGWAPYGTWTVAGGAVLPSYLYGTDNCYSYGVVCPDDVAVLVLNTQNGGYPGTATGWLGYGWNGYGFVNNTTEIAQLGYPIGLDNALLMERNDSQGYVNSTFSNNTVLGSNMNGGSSGGPWVVNFGIAPTLTGETNGSAPGEAVVGVTSWGYLSTAPKEMGASPFTSGNIAVLVDGECNQFPAACR
jgi:V8-like Glu-specific endopeptidase